MIVTLAEAKAYLKITLSTYDSLIQTLIDKADAYIRKQINRDLGVQTYVQLYDGSGDSELLLDHYPVTEIHHLSTDVDYELKKAESLLINSDIVCKVNSGVVILVDDVFPFGKKNVFIRYSAGYASIPEDLKMACLEFVAKKFFDIDEKRQGVTGKTVMSDNIQFSIVDLTNETRKQLMLHRKPSGYNNGVDATGWTVES